MGNIEGMLIDIMDHGYLPLQEVLRSVNTWKYDAQASDTSWYDIECAVDRYLYKQRRIKELKMVTSLVDPIGVCTLNSHYEDLLHQERLKEIKELENDDL